MQSISTLRARGIVASLVGRLASRMLLPVALLTFATGCATAPDRDAIPAFRSGAATANQQLQTSFADINRFLRERQIDRAASLQSLDEEAFFTPLAPEDVAKWSRAFGLIDTYAATLEKILDPARRDEAEKALEELGNKIGEVRGEELPAGVAAGFTQLGGLLIQIKAERDALAAIRQADPSIQGVFDTMMTAIGEDPDNGVRGMVGTSWGDVLGKIQVEFLGANGPAARRDVAMRFAATLDQRDAQDADLASLRRSLGLLASAHRELAAGRESDARSLIALVQDEYRVYLERMEALRKSSEEKSKENTP